MNQDRIRHSAITVCTVHGIYGIRVYSTVPGTQTFVREPVQVREQVRLPVTGNL
jgi:hypothetical protein